MESLIVVGAVYGTSFLLAGALYLAEFIKDQAVKLWGTRKGDSE